MLKEPPLLSIKRGGPRPSAEQITAFQNISTSFVVDAMGGTGAMSKSIEPVGQGRDIDCRAAGPALTADCGPADILALLAALAHIQPGDFLISAFHGHQGCAAAGDSVSAMLKNAGGVGLATDGPVRDYAGIVDVGLPIWCTGLTPNSPHSKGPGKVGYPIQIGGRTVETGDMIVADRDGVVVVPFAQLDQVISNLAEVVQLEETRDAAVRGGMTCPAKITELLASDHVQYED